MSKETLIQRVLADPRIQIYDCGRQDIQAGAIDRRVLATLEFLVASGFNPTITSLHCGHSYLTTSGNVSEHSIGTAVDIAAVNGIPILGHQGKGSITDLVIQRLLTLQGTMKPHQIISLMKFQDADNTLVMADHDDHIHVGFHAAVRRRTRRLASSSTRSSSPSSGSRLIERLGEIDNPTVPLNPSKARAQGRATLAARARLTRRPPLPLRPVGVRGPARARRPAATSSAATRATTSGGGRRHRGLAPRRAARRAATRPGTRVTVIDARHGRSTRPPRPGSAAAGARRADGRRSRRFLARAPRRRGRPSRPRPGRALAVRVGYGTGDAGRGGRVDRGARARAAGAAGAERSKHRPADRLAALLSGARRGPGVRGVDAARARRPRPRPRPLRLRFSSRLRCPPRSPSWPAGASPATCLSVWRARASPRAVAAAAAAAREGRARAEPQRRGRRRRAGRLEAALRARAALRRRVTRSRSERGQHGLAARPPRRRRASPSAYAVVGRRAHRHDRELAAGRAACPRAGRRPARPPATSRSRASGPRSMPARSRAASPARAATRRTARRPASGPRRSRTAGRAAPRARVSASE